LKKIVKSYLLSFQELYMEDLYEQQPLESEQETQSNNSIVAQILAAQKTKGRTPKKAKSSAANLAKARAVKLAGLKAAKVQKSNQMSIDIVDENEESEEESEEEYVLRPLKPVPLKRQRAASAPIAIPNADHALRDEIAQLSALVGSMIMKKKKPKPKQRIQQPSVIVNIPQPQQPVVDSAMKDSILKF
jgi:hypothetical protein